jgi:cell division septal protein FtsQ
VIHEEGGPAWATDRRYWRRRVNRQVRKKRRTRSLLRWTVIGLVNVLVLSIVVFSLLQAVEHMKSSSEFALQAIQLEGVQRCSPDSVRGRLDEFGGRNVLDLDLEDVAERVREEPWVLDCSVKRILPHALRVTIVEREPCALARIGKTLVLVDRTGHPVEPADPSLAEAMPILTGLNRMTEIERAAALKRGIENLETLRETVGGWAATLREIDLSRADRITVKAAGIQPRFLLDPEQADRNVSDYLALRGEIDDRIGPMEYVDLRWRDRIAVMPEEEFLIVEDR